jgi:hypothetical protein
MNFLNPWLLVGIAGIASPVVIHLLARKQIKRVVWAAMRFLKATVDRHKRKMTLEDILLLVARCLVIALIACALARPALRGAGYGAIGANETAILLLDQSASMCVTDGVATRFEKAKKAAEEIVDALPSGSGIAVWLVSDMVRDTIPEPTRDLALARKTIRDARRTDQGTDWQPAIRKAVDALKRVNDGSKQLYVVTDGQAAGWKNPDETRQLLDVAKQGIQARLILITEGEERNVAITNVRLASAMVPARQPARFEVTVANFGPEEVRDVSVSLAINDEPPGEEQLVESLPGSGESKTVSLFASFPQPGSHTVTASLRSDRCAFDDLRTAAVKVIDDIDVLLVDGDPGAEPRDSEVFYLRNALTPVAPEMRDRYFIKTKTIAAADLERTPLSDFEAIVLANVVDLSPAAVAALETYVRGGGGFMVFPGSRISLPFYNERLHAQTRLLPAAYGEPRGEPIEETKAELPQVYFHLQAKGYTHRITEPWNDAKNGSLATAQFYRAFPMQLAKDDAPHADAGSAFVVLAFGDGTPAIVEQAFGAGRVLQFASTADAAWNDLPIRPIFLPLVHRALGYVLARQEDFLNIRAGSPFTHSTRSDLAGKELRIVAPGQNIEDAFPHQLDARAQPPRLRYEATEISGAYRVLFREDPALNFRFAVQSNPAESALREISPRDLHLINEVAPVIRWTPGADLRGSIQHERGGTEFWLPILFLVLGLVIAETVCGNRWSRSR